MNEELIIRITALKKALAEDSRVLRLNDCEKAMENDEQVMLLAYQKDLCESKYNDAIRHHGENSPEAKEARKSLFIAKKKLDEHPLVVKYLSAYQQVRILYEEINEKLFASFEEQESGCGGKK
ncbi:MAG: YlbF family regulator [Bacilli bacterium]|jgi:cell fate (sporulation/competence/biofilm development) regulator YlbF (YheA/YmcA/DUF963 family)